MAKRKKQKDPKVIFRDEDHSYWIEGKKGISVSNLLGRFHDKLDEPYWLTYGAYKKIFGEEGIKQLKRDIGYKFPANMKPPNSFFDICAAKTDPADFFKCKALVKQEWLDSQINGTAFHLDRENECYDNGFSINPFTGERYPVIKYEKQYDNQSLSDDLSNLKEGCYPELLVWHEFENYCLMGQVDLAYVTEKDGQTLIDINDYKTNAKLGSRQSHYKYHKPFSHLSDSKLVKYNLQQSAYMYLLELAGHTPRHLAIEHFKRYDPKTGKIYQFKYMRDEVKLMMDLVDKEFANVKN